MILFVKAIERRAVDAEQRRSPVRGLELVEVDQQAHDAVTEAVTDRFEPRVHDLADIERGGVVRFGVRGWNAHRHSAASENRKAAVRQGAIAPSASATARLERRPSSWKPYPVQAPQNEVCRCPWISGRRFWAAKARAVNCGWSQRYLPNVSSSAGGKGGFRLTNSGLSSSMPCSAF